MSVSHNWTLNPQQRECFAHIAGVLSKGLAEEKGIAAGIMRLLTATPLIHTCMHYFSSTSHHSMAFISVYFQLIVWAAIVSFWERKRSTLFEVRRERERERHGIWMLTSHINNSVARGSNHLLPDGYIHGLDSTFISWRVHLESQPYVCQWEILLYYLHCYQAMPISNVGQKRRPRGIADQLIDGTCKALCTGLCEPWQSPDHWCFNGK